MATHDEFNDEKWTPDEKALFAALPREHTPSADLKARTTEAVRHQLDATTFDRRSSRRALILAAAASLIFVAGAVVGFAVAKTAARPTPEPPVASTGQAVARANTPILIVQPAGRAIWY